MSIEVRLNMPLPPEGYEYTGEFRQALAGEPWLDSDGKFRKMESATVGMYAILRKKKKTRPPVPGDIKDRPIPCRMSHDGFEWTDRYLGAVMPWCDRPYCVYETPTHALINQHRYCPVTGQTNYVLRACRNVNKGDCKGFEPVVKPPKRTWKQFFRWLSGV